MNKIDNFTKHVLLNMVSVVAGSIVVGIACKNTKSGWPLIGLALIPRWSYNCGNGAKNIANEQKGDDQNDEG